MSNQNNKNNILSPNPLGSSYNGQYHPSDYQRQPNMIYGPPQGLQHYSQQWYNSQLPTPSTAASGGYSYQQTGQIHQPLAPHQQPQLQQQRQYQNSGGVLEINGSTRSHQNNGYYSQNQPAYQSYQEQQPPPPQQQQCAAQYTHYEQQQLQHPPRHPQQPPPPPLPQIHYQMYSSHTQQQPLQQQINYHQTGYAPPANQQSYTPPETRNFPASSHSAYASRSTAYDPKKGSMPLYAIATTNSSKRAKVASSISATDKNLHPAVDNSTDVSHTGGQQTSGESHQNGTTSPMGEVASVTAPARPRKDPDQTPAQPQKMIIKDLSSDRSSASSTRKKSFRTSRRRHRNSHLGCATCKSRRIKCDEQLPECKNCIRARLSCAYLALDEPARAALKEAQTAHTLRIAALNQQQQEQEEKLAIQQQEQIQQRLNQHEMEIQNQQHFIGQHYLQNELNPYILQSFKYSLSNLPLPTSQPLEINLQRTNFPPINPTLPPPQYPPQTINAVSKHNESIQRPALVELTKSLTRVTSSSSASPSGVSSMENTTTTESTTPNTDILSSSSSKIKENTKSRTNELSYSVESGVYDSLNALIKHHREYIPMNNFSQIDGEYIEIVLDPECLKYLNTYWTAINPFTIDRFKNGFEKEDLYKDYGAYQKVQFKEATSNFLLFKALLSIGQVILYEKSKDEEIRVNSSKLLSRDLELSLRFLNKFRISFIEFNVVAQAKDNFESFNAKKFHENISIVFAKVQIFQAAITTTYHGPYNLKDHMEITDRFFQFIESYLNNQFELLNCPQIISRYANNPFFQRAQVLTQYMQVFIMYYVQCIKSYHSKPYNFELLREIYNEFSGNVRLAIFDKLSSEEQCDFNNLELYLKYLLDYMDGCKNHGKITNKYQMLFYIIKRYIEVLPEEYSINSTNRSFESHLLMSYFNAITSGLREIFPETRFFFLYSFSGNQGTIVEQSVTKYYESLTNIDDTRLSEKERSDLKERKEAMKYPIKVFTFLKNRLFLYSQFLADITNFPAKIILDDMNRNIVFNLVQEEQLTSIKNIDIPPSAYPNVDKNSNFYNRSTNTIQIPSVSTVASYTNFAASHQKRKEFLTKAIEQPFTEWDEILLKKLYPKAGGTEIS